MSFFTRVGMKMRTMIRNKYDRARLKDKDFSIITNQCMGGIIYNDLGMRFLSPTINLKILPDEFIVFVENLEEYLSLPVTEVEDKTVNYPVGQIAGSHGTVTLWFVHYTSFDDAVSSWNSRKKRVNHDDIRVMMTIRDGCTQDTIDRFNRLAFRHKVMFANEPHPECACSIHSHLSNGRPLPGYISDVINVFGKRAYECGFDYIRYIRFLNGE